jgi:two-component system, sensor histidine kinase PdtaS
MQAHIKRGSCLLTCIIILLVAPVFSFSQTEKVEILSLMEKLKKNDSEASRVHIFLTVSEYYLSKSDIPGRGFDSALYFVSKALFASKILKPETGENVPGALTENFTSRNIEIKPALNLLKSQRDSTLFRLLIVVSKYYLFKKNRSKSDIDSSYLLLDQANKIATVSLPEKWKEESLHARAVFYFRSGNIQQGKKVFKELIDKISKPGNVKAEADYWHEFAKLIPSRDTIELTKLYCLERAISLYKSNGDEEKEIGILEDIADMHMSHGKFVLAETQLLNLLQRYKAINNPNLHWTYNLLAVTNYRKGDFTKGIFYGLKAIESMEATHDYRSANTFYSNLAHMYRELGQPKKSVEWYWKLFRNRKFTDESNMYIYRDAGLLTRELIKLKKEKEALAFILDIEARNKPSSVYSEASLLASLAYCYRMLNLDQQTEKYYVKLIKLTNQLQQNNEITTDIHYELGQYLIEKKQYEKAVTHLQKALSASQGINTLSITKDIYMMLYKADSAKGNYLSAIQHLMKHKEMNDSIFNETKSRQIEELQVQYETAKKEKDIELLANQNQLQRIRVVQANKTINITLAGAALLLIIVGLLLNRSIIKQRINRRLEAHKMEVDQKNSFLATLNSEQDKLLKEKEWLIREVHHRVKNNLQLVISLLNTQSAYLDDNAAVLAIRDSLRRMEAMSLIHKKLYQSKNISLIAMPEYVNELIHYLFDSFDIVNRIVFQQNIARLDLDASQAIPLGLIINESIVNAIKYAFPNGKNGVVSISLQCDEADHLLLKISDNGIGLPADFDITGNNSLGLDLMQGLAKQLNGSFAIESDDGLRIMVRFPALNNNLRDDTAQIL